jgi:hypothetical protein
VDASGPVSEGPKASANRTLASDVGSSDSAPEAD